MKTYKFIICLLLFVAFISCESEKLDIKTYGVITGVILESESYNPVQGVLVSTTPASISMITDAEGKFTIPKLPEGEVVVNFKKKDYLSNAITIAVYENDKTQHKFLITKDVDDVGQITLYDPVPGNGAVDQGWAVTLKWNVDGKRTSTILTYSVYIFESNSTVQRLLGEDLDLKEVTTNGLKPLTTYYWYVVAKYEGNKIAFSPTWTFKTVKE